ncbi:hypothetical protein QN277_028560 [Acacia crassicarpa]|uniref:MADS-box domain-containing protein n=1 Tax=Acacia crassicarpa TaxID=499986 RepID=A0AAE1J525_9FABA|nr:hypothetical protein QN277_028560 [Acacia crassicarpa]
MGRRKLAMKTLENRNARRALFERRKKGLLRKASELSTLCGIKACVIIFPPPDSENSKAETFPEDPTQVIHNIQMYNAKKNCPEKQRKNYDLCEFFNDRKNQVEAETSRVRKQKLKMLCPTDDSFHNLGEDQLRMLISTLDSKIQDCDHTIGLLKAKKSEMPVVPMGLDLLDYLVQNTSDLVQNTSDEANAFSPSDPMMQLVGGNNTDFMDDQELGFGLENIDLDIFLGLEWD